MIEAIIIEGTIKFVLALAIAYCVPVYIWRTIRARRARRIFEGAYIATREQLHREQRAKACYLAALRDDLS